MSRTVLVGTTIAMSLGWVLGCRSEKQTAPAPAEKHSHVEHAAGEATEIDEALADLSVADRKVVEAQKMCPVSDQVLGSMGMPIKVVVEDRQLFVCCEGCVDKAKENFDKYFAQLNSTTK